MVQTGECLTSAPLIYWFILEVSQTPEVSKPETVTIQEKAVELNISSQLDWVKQFQMCLCSAPVAHEWNP